jgi:hypothetical protein
MKRPHKLIFSALTLTLFLGYARPCSIPDPEAVFVRLSGPDHPYKTYAAGRLGVILNTYRPRHLVIAYNYLNGRPLTTQEQSQAIAADQNIDWEAYRDTQAPTTPGLDQWLAARKLLTGANNTLATNRNIPGQQYESFENCLDDAFLTAAHTLAARQQSYGKSSPEVHDWLDAQDTVFANCGSNIGSIPQLTPPNAPLWLKQDRSYQIAAANFYATNFYAAITGFRTIAADQTSPWHTLAPYLVARVLVRQTELAPPPAADKPNPAAAEQRRVHDGLTAALQQVDAILRDPTLKSIHPAASNLRDLIAARVEPEAQAQALAQRLTAPPHGADFRQNLIDLTYILDNQTPAKPQSNDLLAFIQTINTPTTAPRGSIYNPPSPETPTQTAARLATQHTAAQTANTQWQSTKKPAWLVAALSLAQPNDPFTSQLIADAHALPTNSPAYTSATYYRLRLEADTQPARAELATILPTIERSQSRSTINLFAGILTPTSPTLIDFLKTAPRIPASSNDDGALASAAEIPTPQLCGPKVPAAQTPLFETYAATMLNQRLPLHLLREAAVSNALPPNLRFQLTNAALTRAILLDDPATVAALTPVLTACQPAFKSVLDRYNSATTPDQRHMQGLFALMSFPSIEPLVRTGNQRSTGFATYSNMRDNWWCGNIVNVQDSNSTNYRDIIRTVYPESSNFKPALFNEPLVPTAELSSPPFITAADTHQANEEIARLQHLPSPPDYFATEALAWVKAHPNDPHNPDLLGFAKRTMRNGCRTSASTDLDHQLFNTLNRKYPNSTWTKRYKTWE